MNIKSSKDLLADSHIYIKYNNDIALNNYSTILLQKFMIYINGMIGAKTSANYHIKRVKNNTIDIPIYVYTNKEKKLDPISLIENKVKNVRNFLENYDWNIAGKQQLWLVRSLKILGINISSAFTISTSTPNSGFNDLNNDPLIIKFPSLSYPIIEKETFIDKSYIVYLSDPYLMDYGIYDNLTVPFDEMGMSYNGLHLYEHLMTKGWDNLSGKNLLELNGSTYPHALCFVYNIHSDLNSMKEYAASSIIWTLKSRKKGFWSEHKQELDLETERTISETRNERTLNSMGRSDFHAYDYNYNTDIFEYWSNKPFGLLIVGPEPLDKLKLKSDTINNLIKQYMPREDIKRPENIKFKNIPIDVLKMKKIQGISIAKVDSEKIKKDLLSKDFDGNFVYGLDCSLCSKNEDLSSLNSVLHPLLFNARLMNNEDLNKFINTHVLPFSALMFSNAPIQLKNTALYLQSEDLEEYSEDSDNESTNKYVPNQV